MQDIQIGYTLWPADFELIYLGPWLDEAEAAGVDTVEVPLFTTRVIIDGRVHDEAFRLFAAPLEGRSVGITTHGMLTINLMDAPEKLTLHETVLAANIELTARLGATRMVLHCGMSGETGQALEDAYARQRESLARMAEIAAAHGVVICVETVWNFDGRETALPSRLAAEIEAVGHPNIRATLDYAHSLLQCQLKGADFHQEIAAIAPHSVHLHLNDCFAPDKDYGIAFPTEAVAYGSGDLHLPIGWGAIPWDRVLTEPPYPRETLTMNQELHPRFWPALGRDVAEMRRLRDLMQQRNAAPWSASA